MKNKILFLLFAVYYLLFTIAPVVEAISPTLTASPAAEEIVGEKIKEIREAVKEKVREKIQEIKKGIPKAFVGEITEIGDSILTLGTLRGEKKVRITEDTKIVGKGGKNEQLRDLKIGDFCIAMGYLADDGVLEAKRLVVITKPKAPAREVAFGRVTDISTEEKVITVKNEKKGLTYTISVTDKTIITKKVETKIEKVKFSDIEIGDRMVAIGTPSENEEKIITAKIIHVIPGLSKPTVSPKPTASPTPEK